MAHELTSASESLFWYWIAERHAIYLRRKAGQSKPWTADPILRDYKFTNPFRENDRGTVWLRENFLEPHRDDDLGIVAFNICWYRMFNWTGTGERLWWKTGWDVEETRDRLWCAFENGEQIFTGAHIVRGEFDRPKIDSIVDVCAELFAARDTIATCCRDERSLQRTFEELRRIKYVGPFMAYEMVTDMRHTRLLEDATDIMTWANPGPGARRGLERLELLSRPDTSAIESMRYLLSHSMLGYGAAAYPDEGFVDATPHSGFPQFEMRDIEHSLCEFDKYCRVKFGEGRPRSRYPGAA